jgi:hypothetical protein
VQLRSEARSRRGRRVCLSSTLLSKGLRARLSRRELRAHGAELRLRVREASAQLRDGLGRLSLADDGVGFSIPHAASEGSYVGPQASQARLGDVAVRGGLLEGERGAVAG